ncbi:MAP kinase kinase (MEK) [Sorochytrium milnesiophthora]
MQKKFRPALKVALPGQTAPPAQAAPAWTVAPAVSAGQFGQIQKQDITPIAKLGEGASGAVVKCLHTPTGTTLAKKSVPIDPQSSQALSRELALLHACQHPNIVVYYGCYMEDDNSMAICMEHCDMGSLDYVYRRIYAHGGFLSEDILGKITSAVISALTYLHANHRVVHRDIKPSNILLTRNGVIKLCDFGVSGLLVNSMAQTFVGTSFYMAPERIQGETYTIKSDIWSLGVTLLELALGKFPYPFSQEVMHSITHSQRSEGRSNAQVPIFELLQYVVNEPTPTVPPELLYDANKNPAGRLSVAFSDFVRICLDKSPQTRPSPKDMTGHLFVQHWDAAVVDVAAWLEAMSQFL